MKNNGIKLFTQDIDNEIIKTDKIINDILELKGILKENFLDKYHIVPLDLKFIG